MNQLLQKYNVEEAIEEENALSTKMDDFLH